MSASLRRFQIAFTAGALTLALLIVTTTAIVLRPTAASARPIASSTSRHGPATPSDRWLTIVNASEHRQLFDTPAPNGGIALVHILNYYETLNGAYKVKDAQIAGIGTFYGATTFYGLNDAMWAKYRLGEFLETSDPTTSRPAVKNPWRTAPVVLGMTLPQASIESLQKRGATFILCNNALTIFAGLLAKSRGLNADAVYADLASNILPGVELVPGMVVAIEQAHTAGISYHRQ